MSTDPVAPNSLGAPTNLDIKAAWESIEKPSQRGIEKIMRAAGWDVSASTIIRCVNSGFSPRRHKSTKAVETSPEIDAVRQVQAVAPDDAPPAAVAAALVEAIKNLPDGQKDRVKELLEMSDDDLDKQSSRLVKVARVLLAEDLAKHTKMMMLVPDKAAKLYAALGTGTAPIIQPPPAPGAGDGAKVIEHNPDEPVRLSASAQAIANFRAKRGSVAA